MSAQPSPAAPLEQGIVQHSAAQRNKAWTFVDQRVQSKLPPEDFVRIADVRRQLWTAGLTGAVGGAAAGFAAFSATRQFFKPKWLSKNHLFLFPMLGAAVFSFIGTNAAGHGKMTGLADVFERHALNSALETHQQQQTGSPNAGNSSPPSASHLSSTGTSTTTGGDSNVSLGYRHRHLQALKAAEEEDKEKAKRLLSALEAHAATLQSKPESSPSSSSPPLAVPVPVGSGIRYDDDLSNNNASAISIGTATTTTARGKGAAAR